MPEYDGHRRGGRRRADRRAARRRTPTRAASTLGHDDACELLGPLRHRRTAAPSPPPTRRRRRAPRARLGYPVALKTTAPHLRHRADLGGVRLDLADEAAAAPGVRRADRACSASPPSCGPSSRPWHRAASTPSYGPSSTRPPAPSSPSGSPGAASELLGDTAHRLVPVTDRDAAELIRSIRTAPAPLRLARLGARRHRGARRAAAAGVAARRRPPRGGRRRPGTGRRRHRRA